MDQKSIQKSMGKIIDFSMVLEGSWGGGPHRAAIPRRAVSDPLITNYQTPLELGKWAWARASTGAWARVLGA